jgi:hypothetical protein
MKLLPVRFNVSPEPNWLADWGESDAKFGTGFPGGVGVLPPPQFTKKMLDNRTANTKIART